LKEQEHGMPQDIVVANTITFVKPRNKENSVMKNSVMNLLMVEHRSKEIDLNVVI
jgi:hypothetical protein